MGLALCCRARGSRRSSLSLSLHRPNPSLLLNSFSTASLLWADSCSTCRKINTPKPVMQRWDVCLSRSAATGDRVCASFTKWSAESTAGPSGSLPSSSSNQWSTRRCSEAHPPPSGTSACVSRRSCAGCASAKRFSASRATDSRSSPGPEALPLARPTLISSTVESIGSLGPSITAAPLKSVSLASFAMGWPLALATASNKRVISATENSLIVAAAASATPARHAEIASVLVPATARLRRPCGRIFLVNEPRDASVAAATFSSFEVLPLLARHETHSAKSPRSMTSAHFGSFVMHLSSRTPVLRTVLITRHVSSVLFGSKSSKTA
mmetsp:Transcript_117902/g.328439  ORF Transcript_117902/g.328439 Transcript_117902/m.328439 type:complete len:325 (+) Transcript_117902:838-1812(+)